MCDIVDLQTGNPCPQRWSHVLVQKVSGRAREYAVCCAHFDYWNRLTTHQHAAPADAPGASTDSPASEAPRPRA